MEWASAVPVESFFRNLNWRRETERDLDAFLSSDFNVFSYIDPDENGISNIVAELLNAHGSHGQGGVFLDLFLDQIGKNDLKGLDAVVAREARTTFVNDAPHRRIDVTVTFGNEFGIGIENKPEAREQPDWVKHYSEHLDKRFNGKYLLLYLSGDGSDPEENSELVKKLRADKKYMTIGYTDEMKHWLKLCYQRTRSDKFRWFLLDFISYVKGEGKVMVSEPLKNSVIQYLMNADENLKIAEAVKESWKDAIQAIVTDFVEALTQRLNEKLGTEWIVSVRPEELLSKNGDFVVRKPVWDGHSICIEANVGGARDFFIGVSKPETAKHIPGLAEALKMQVAPGTTNEWWEWWRWADDGFRNWDNAETLIKLRGKEGVAYFAEAIENVARVAGPIIDDHLGVIK